MNATTKNFLTFPQFQASKVEVADVATAIGFDNGVDRAVPGFTYAENACYIEKYGDRQFYLIIERSDWIDDDLAKLERILWAAHYCSEVEGAVLLRDDGTLDDFIVGMCAYGDRPVDGDLFGVLFSGNAMWSPSEAREVIVTANAGVRSGGEGVQSGHDTNASVRSGGVGVQSAPFLTHSRPARALVLSDAELTNLITACKTSAMRTGSPDWQAGLDAIADKLYAARDA